MAIQFARARYISRSTGGDAVRSAAYNARADLLAQRTGQLFYFKHRDAPEHHEILLPAGADEKFADCSLLWNAAEAAEKRKDSQVAREILLALPSDPGVTDEDRIELARSFALTHFVSKGLAVQLDVHAPHEPVFDGEETGAPANHHAHLLITVRRLEGGVFAAKKATDLDPQVRACTPHIYGGVVKHGFVANALAWGELWREHQDRYFVERGLAARVDPVAIHPGQHIGPVRMRQLDSELVERAELLRQANEEAARDPAQVLEVLTRNNATFSEKDLDRFLGKHIDDEAQRAVAKRAVLDHPTTLALCDVESFAPIGRWTVREVRRQEQVALAEAAALAGDAAHRGISEKFAQKTLAARQLREDQQAAFDHATGAGGLKLIEGRAGTGKSYTLQAIREAHERAGFRVIGLAPTNTVAQDLKAEGFAEAATIYAELFALKNGRAHWDRNTVVIVDEAAMLDSRITGELLAAARASQAKLILAGDDKQLASIERGGLFTELKHRHGAAAITNVTRQRADWQRQAAMDLAEGRFIDAVTAFDTHGAISWSATQDFSRTVLVETWKKDGVERPQSARFVFAYTNQDVDALNADLRAVVREQGGLSGSDVMFETRHGPLAFAVGDRVQFTDTKKSAGLYNGNAGVITAIDPETGQLSARLDAVAGQGREVSWSAAEFDGFRHGYAGTIYKGQGKTLDRTYLYHTHHWRSAASYVALTRQRDSAQIFVARDAARNTRDLARQMARGEIKSASVAFATMEEVAAAREASLQEVKSRLTREPGFVRRNLETWRIGEILRPVLPALTQAFERHAAAFAGLGDAAEGFAGQVRAFFNGFIASQTIPPQTLAPKAIAPEAMDPAVQDAWTAIEALRKPPKHRLEVKNREERAWKAIRKAPREFRDELKAAAQDANRARIDAAIQRKEDKAVAAILADPPPFLTHRSEETIRATVRAERFENAAEKEALKRGLASANAASYRAELMLRARRAEPQTSDQREVPQLEHPVIPIPAADLALPATDPVVPAEDDLAPQPGPAQAARKNKFAGLKLGRPASNSVPQPPGPAPKPLHKELQDNRHTSELMSFARALIDASRMTQAGLPVLPHQEEALRLAVEELDQIKPGLNQDAFAVMTGDPQLARDAAAGQEIQVREFCSRVEARQQAREALTARGRGAIQAWTKLEQDYEVAGKARNWDAERAIGMDMVAFAKTLKQDAALDTLLRERGRELGIAEGSRLDSVVRAQEIDRTLTRAINIEHGPKPNHSPGPGM